MLNSDIKMSNWGWSSSKFENWYVIHINFEGLNYSLNFVIRFYFTNFQELRPTRIRKLRMCMNIYIYVKDISHFRLICILTDAITQKKFGHFRKRKKTDRPNWIRLLKTVSKLFEYSKFVILSSLNFFLKIRKRWVYKPEII